MQAAAAAAGSAMKGKEAAPEPLDGLGSGVGLKLPSPLPTKSEVLTNAGPFAGQLTVGTVAGPLPTVARAGATLAHKVAHMLVSAGQHARASPAPRPAQGTAPA